MRLFFTLLIGSLLFTGCDKASQKYDKAYFDIDSLLQAQSKMLLAQKVMLRKTATLDGKKEDSSFQPDSALLAHELDVFQQIDVINKPLYRSGYKITDGEKDTRSNLLIRTYKATGTSPVPFLKIYYHETLPHLKKIESIYRVQNTLYTAERVLTLEFDDADGTALLSSYSLHGTQKMTMSDSVHFSVEGHFASH